MENKLGYGMLRIMKTMFGLNESEKTQILFLEGLDR